ncbi:MAG: hypothetical protein MRJ93_14775 [Nitrososphaeraceae archaeon]|nr:hypothetical protein [Nitrososphaeraceae archaeon]
MQSSKIADAANGSNGVLDELVAGNSLPMSSNTEQDSSEQQPKPSMAENEIQQPIVQKQQPESQIKTSDEKVTESKSPQSNSQLEQLQAL